MKIKKSIFTRSKRLRKDQLAVIFGLQAVMPFLAFAAAYTLKQYDILPFDRLLFLLLLVSSTFGILICVIGIWKPLMHLKHIMIEWKIKKNIPEIKQLNNSELEILFADILYEQIKSIEREYKTEVLRHQAELMALQSQINPHFLYNTLDSIRGLAIRHQVSQIADMTEALSKLFRQMIAKESMIIPLAEELQSVDNYMLIQRFRFHNKFIFQTEIEDKSLLELMVPNLVIQPIVENAIVHGLENKEENGIIRIYAYATQNRLIIAIEDNGVGVPPEKLDAINAMLLEEKSSEKEQSSEDKIRREKIGIALSNINQRIRLRFGSDYGVNIMSTPGISTSVEIILPRLSRETAYGQFL